jgi:superfamily II DNA or RNA helicase
VHDLTSQTKDREAVLKYFEEGEIHVLTSMKCLDEGVDIPRAELAVFCSSTGNPRQFIQRRGRVMRLHKDKNQATIHDLVAVPNWEESDRTSETYKAERNLMRRELMRVAHFVDLAENRYEAMEMLQEICEAYDLNINILRDEIEK